MSLNFSVAIIAALLTAINAANPYGGLSGPVYTDRGAYSVSGGGHTALSGAPLSYGGHGGHPQIVQVEPDHVPVQVHFKTASSRVNVQQSHNAGHAPQVEHASFQDEPHRVIHEVVKPVIQEVREIIQPYRRVTQEIRPVIEEVHTVVHKGEGRGGRGGGLGPAGGHGYVGGGGGGGAALVQGYATAPGSLGGYANAYAKRARGAAKA